MNTLRSSSAIPQGLVVLAGKIPITGGIKGDLIDRVPRLALGLALGVGAGVGVDLSLCSRDATNLVCILCFLGKGTGKNGGNGPKMAGFRRQFSALACTTITSG